MTTNEAKAAYIKAKKNYQDVIASYDRTQLGAREARFRAYDELKAAEIDLADVSVDKIEAETGKNLSEQLAAIVGDATARSECAEKIFLNLA